MPSLMLHASMKAIKKSSNSLGSFLSFIMGFESHLKRPWCCGRRILCALLTHFSFSSSILFSLLVYSKAIKNKFYREKQMEKFFQLYYSNWKWWNPRERWKKKKKKFFLSQCLILAIDCVKSHFCPSRHSSLKS